MNNSQHDRDDATSDYEASDTTSGFTSIPHVINVYQYGRRYQGFIEDRYPLPNDEKEAEREELAHQLWRSLLGGKLFVSPVGNNPSRVADMGCGTGIWAVDVGDDFPSSRVIGIDLSNTQPTWVPLNVEFRLDDLESDWGDLHMGTDLFFYRSVDQTMKNVPLLLEQTYSNLKPGGWVEFQDTLTSDREQEGTLSTDHPYIKSLAHIRHGFASTYGWDIDTPLRLPDMLREAGFTNVQQRVESLPIGPWGSDENVRERGLMVQQIVGDAILACLLRHTDLNISAEEAQELRTQTARSFRDPRNVVYADWAFTWAQKPTTNTTFTTTPETTNSP